MTKLKKSFSKIIISFIVALAVAIVMFGFLFFQIKSDMNDFGSKVLEYGENMINESYFVLSRLENPKKSDHLLNMRLELFHADYIKDIVYFENNTIVSTATLGKFKFPLKKYSPDLLTKNEKYEIWLHHESIYGYIVTADILIKRGKYGVIVDEEYFNQLNDIYKWEMSYFNYDRYYHFLGSEEVFHDAMTSFIDKSFYKKIDSNNYDYSIGVMLPIASVLSKYQLYIQWIVILIMISFILSYYLLKKREEYLESPENRILSGLESDQFYFLYQPIVSLKTREIIGAEVLARFMDDNGQIYPDQFIPLIIKNNKTWEFTKKLFEYILNELDNINIKGYKFRISINIFPQDIMSMKVLQLKRYRKLLKDYNIVLEVIEEQYLEEKKASRVINELRKYGFKIAIDDFGTGYSNLSSLNSLAVDYLKIDKSFVFEMEDCSIKSALIPNMVQIGKSLNLLCVAEGIENENQLELLDALGVELGQGYYFSKPRPLTEVYRMFRSQIFNKYRSTS